MKKEEIEPWNWERMLLGQAPVEFMLEVLFRTLLIYVILLIVLRLLGKRMDGQLGLTEVALMITFGAVISVAAQMPERGLLMGALALVCVLAFQRGINWLAVKSDRVERIVEGDLNILVKDGIIQVDEMHKAGISKQQLFASLRKKKLYNLGKVKRVYFEACGIFSIYEAKQSKTGLPVYPPFEQDLYETEVAVAEDKIACINCGFSENKSEKSKPCQVCGETMWERAVN